MIDDGKLIEGCLRNKRRAQKQLYNKYAPKMLGVCLRYCKNRQDAEDVLQDAFIKAFKSIENYQHRGSFEGWIRRIVVNTTLTHLRKNKERWFVELDNIPVEEETEDKSHYNKISPEVLIRYIQELPDGYRTVLNLFVFEKYSHKEIATTLDITEGTSKSQFSKAKTLLKKRIEKDLNKEFSIK